MAYRAQFAIPPTFPDPTSQNVGSGMRAVGKSEKEKQHFVHGHTHLLTHSHTTPASCPTHSDLHATGLVDTQVAIVYQLPVYLNYAQNGGLEGD